jgi:hypothetical protein
MAEVMIFEGSKEKYILFDEDTEVLLRHIDAAKLRKLRAKGQKMANLGGGAEAEHNNRLIGEEAVQGWRHVDQVKFPGHPGFIMQGQPVPFNEVNRNKFMGHWLKFSNFVNENTTDSESFAEQENNRIGGLDAVKED